MVLDLRETNYFFNESFAISFRRRGRRNERVKEDQKKFG